MNVSSIVDVTTFGLSENSRRTITLESNAQTDASDTSGGKEEENGKLSLTATASAEVSCGLCLQ